MDIGLTKLLLNAGLLILIWIVQLVIYPSFLYYSEADIKTWHPNYTNRVSFVVLPLMLGQLIVYSYSLITGRLLADILIVGLIIFNWLVTFAVAVPLHNKIDSSNNSIKLRQKLVTINWLRTVGWTIIFLISLNSYHA